MVGFFGALGNVLGDFTTLSYLAMCDNFVFTNGFLSDSSVVF